MLRNIGSNWALALIQIAVLMQLTPIQVHILGESVNGTWLAIASATSYLGLLILGVPMASVRFIAGHVARKEVDETNRAISTCLGLCLGLGVVALVVGSALSLVFEHFVLHRPEWASLGPARLAEARIALGISVLQVSAGFVAQLPFGILDAHDHFVARNGVKIAGLILRLVLIVGALRFFPSLVVLALIQVAVMALEFGVSMLVIRRSWPHLRFRLKGFDPTRLRAILGFSLFAMLLNMGIQLSFQSDQLVIGMFMSPDDGTFFDVGNKFFPALMGLVIGIGMVMMPMATKLQVKGELGELRAVFLKWSKVAYSLALLVGVYLLVLGPEFLAWWMGPSYAMSSGRVTRVIMFSFLFFLPVRGVASPMLMGLGKPAWPSLAFLAMGAINLAFSLALVKPLGIFGVAVGTAIPCVLFAVGVLWLACREVSITLTDYASYVMLRPTLGVIPPILFLYALKRGMHVFHIFAPRWEEFFPLFLSGVGMVGLFLFMWVFFVYRNDPYFDLFARVEPFIPRVFRRKDTLT
jgi:O-antigen/teichoic acid export membrane protein